MVLKQIFVEVLCACASFKTIKFPWGNYKPIVPRQKHSIVYVGSKRENRETVFQSIIPKLFVAMG